MAVEVPKAEKVYTTTYNFFKGVDFTNDATNVYKRRSPSAVNMIPDLDGRPYKRTGWEKEITTQMFLDAYNETALEPYYGDVKINNIGYFEIAGLDHISIFTDIGLYMYREKDDNTRELVLISIDNDVKNSSERTFFFEGDGVSAYYIYGNYKIWSYKLGDNGFVFDQEDPYVPRIRISVSANGDSAVALEDTNMVGNKVAEEFQNNLVPYISGSTGTTSVNSDLFLARYSTDGTHTFTKDGSNWRDSFGVVVGLSGIGIVPTSSATTITVTVESHYMTYLAYPLTSDSGVEVWVADASVKGEAFGRQLTPTTSTPASGEFKVVTTGSDDATRTHIEFAEAFTPLVEGEDAIRVEYPITRFTKSSHSLGDTTVVWR